ncbi:MAG: ABC transporter ATP-binding protein [Gammaproteobacteria bacterium]|nr:ABC transporter ATP-binding protein [Gammaproteobacteria bacterium]MYF58915.1 ABC transporter ATP-binding protein [Gammaproteobacteria bacterium]MYH33869.1 ABC transporter ATP-binding protein [Gammaproteobacteria bacterium]MYL02216.1 ABC transporter ATP-binding protein [Gammaproteobacteria bacterium]
MTLLLEIRDLSVRFDVGDAELTAVRGLSLDVAEGECLGVVGESGAGKSQTFLAALGLLAGNARAEGSVRYRGREILNAPRRELDTLRGRRLAMVFQDPLSGLTSTLRIGRQLEESARRHLGMNARQARQKALEMLDTVRLPDPKRCLDLYPFELSGGMRQRVMIALGMICRPDLLIADEPTTALDVTIQAQILGLLAELRRDANTSVVLITHDLAVAAGLCDRILIMYNGRAVESGTTREVFAAPKHPYTAGLLASLPSLATDAATDLPAIPGQPPDALSAMRGCAFAERCEHVMDRCLNERPLLGDAQEQHTAACHLISP